MPKQRWPLYAVIGAVGTIVGTVAVVSSSRGAREQHRPRDARRVDRDVGRRRRLPRPRRLRRPTATDRAARRRAPRPSSTRSSSASLRRTRRSRATARTSGGAPVAIHLADGESAKLVISRKGYKTKTVTVDGGDPKVSVTLESAFGPAPQAAGGRRCERRQQSGGIDDVGDPFAKKH